MVIGTILFSTYISERNFYTYWDNLNNINGHRQSKQKVD